MKHNDVKPYEKITVALDAEQVTRVGALTVHPSNERRDWQAWCVGTPCGMAAGKFATREAAEMFARSLAKLADWDASPVGVEEASAWSRAHFVGEVHAALRTAMADAREVDEASAPELWP